MTLVVFAMSTLARYQEAIVPLVYELKEKGVKVTVIWHHAHAEERNDIPSEYDVPLRGGERRSRTTALL
jgi:hypothetical protein